MKNVKRIVGVAVVIAAVATVAIGSGMIQKTPEAVQKTVVGKVYNKEITVSQVDSNPQMQQLYSMVESQVQGNPMDNAQAKKTIVSSREQTVNSIIEQDIIKQQVIDQKITATDAEVDAEYNKELDQFIQQAGGDKTKGTAAFNEALKSSKYKDEAGFKAAIKEQLPEQKVISNVINAVPKVTTAEAETYYNENKSQYTQEPGADVYQIVVDSKEKADQLRSQFLEETKGMTNVQDKLAVFSKLATANNVDNTKTTGGSLGYVKYSDTNLVPAFMDAVKGLKQAGDVSAVVNSKTSSYNVYNIVFVSQVNTEATVTPFATVNKDNALVDKLYQQKQQQAFTTKLAEWKKAAGAEVYTSKLDYALPAASTTQTSQAPTTGGSN